MVMEADKSQVLSLIASIVPRDPDPSRPSDDSVPMSPEDLARRISIPYELQQTF